HSVDALMRGTVSTFQTSLGGWWTAGSAGGEIDTWIGAMDSPWATNDGSVISDADKNTIKSAIGNAVANPAGSLFTAYGFAGTTPSSGTTAGTQPQGARPSGSRTGKQTNQPGP